MTELQVLLKIKPGTFSVNRGGANNRSTNNSVSDKQSANELLLIKYRDLYDTFNKFIRHIPHEVLSKAAFECKAYCRALMHYELHIMRSATTSVGSSATAIQQIQGSSICIKQEHLIELQNLYASMDEIDAASGILLLKNGSEESLADAAFRHKVYQKSFSLSKRQK